MMPRGEASLRLGLDQSKMPTRHEKSEGLRFFGATLPISKQRTKI